jgi:hypothetical protein
MSATTFLEMTATARMRRVEAMRSRIRRLHREHGYPPPTDKRLSPKADAWRRRLCTALVDTSCSDEGYREVDRAAFAAIVGDEAVELRQRLREFAEIRDAYPLDAKSNAEALVPVLKALLRKAEAQDKAAE